MDLNKIIEDYKNKMFSKDICKKYNISWKTLTKLLKREGVYVKNNSLQLSQEKLEFIKNNYHILSNKEISNTLNLSADWLTQIAKRLNLQVKGSGWKYRPFLKNINYSSKEFFYFLGWMASDGNISKNFHNISISCLDKDVIEYFHNMFPSSFIYTRIQPNGKTIYRFCLCCKELALLLNEKGITPNKSKTLNIPNENWNIDFLRGYFEGDGYVRNPIKSKQTRWEIGFVSASEIFTKQLITFLEKINISSKVTKEKSYFRIKCYGKNNVKTFYDKVYSNCENRFMFRKKQILDQLFSNE